MALAWLPVLPSAPWATAFSLAIILIIAESTWVLATAGALVISLEPASVAAAA